MRVCCCQVEQVSGYLKELELSSKVRAPSCSAESHNVGAQSEKLAS